MLFGGTGFFIDSFHAGSGEGILWLHGYGNVFEKALAPGEIDRHRAGRLALQGPDGDDDDKPAAPVDRAFRQHESIVCNRFTGPGRVGIQSMYLHMPTGD